MQARLSLPKADRAAAVNRKGTMQFGSRRPQSIRRQNSARLRETLEPSKTASAWNVPRLIGGALLVIALVLIFVGVASAQEFTGKDVVVSRPWARATPGGATVGGAFLEIRTTGQGDRLIGAASPAAGMVEIHNHIMENGVAKMRRVEAIAIKGGTSVVLKPGGYHVMLMDLKQPLKEGDTLKLTLQFERAGDIEVAAKVEAIGSKGPPGFDSQAASGASNSDSGHHH
jgi:hypothetical protein